MKIEAESRRPACASTFQMLMGIFCGARSWCRDPGCMAIIMPQLDQQTKQAKALPQDAKSYMRNVCLHAQCQGVGGCGVCKTAMMGDSPAGIRVEHNTHVGGQQIHAAVLEGAKVLCICHLRSAQARSPYMFSSDPRGHKWGTPSVGPACAAVPARTAQLQAA